MGDRDGEVGDAVEEVHGAVNRIDDPLVGSIRITPHSLLPIDRMVGKNPQHNGLDQCLRAAVKLQLDVVGLGGINIQFFPEMAAYKSAGGLRGLPRGDQQ